MSTLACSNSLVMITVHLSRQSDLALSRTVHMFRILSLREVVQCGVGLPATVGDMLVAPPPEAWVDQ